MKIYDVIVVGGGHAGCEAALAAARLGACTAILTLHMDHIAQMSCNPCIGGVAKGHVAREIDALGGAMGQIADASCLQFRMLNRSKGQAVWSPRSQCDKVCYQRGMKLTLETAENLDVLQGEATRFVMDNGRILGVANQFGEEFRAKAAVLANGTFLNGLLHYGMNHFPGGRAGDFPSCELAQALRDQLKLRVGRLKTGTPPRVLAKTIDFSKMEVQPAEEELENFSFWPLPDELPKTSRRSMPCYGVYSNADTAKLVRDNLSEAPLYQGIIKGIGTRYCPSFEDKVVRFAHHERHLLYLEPEGEYTREYYLNGISTSLPPRIQHLMLGTIPGLENTVISRYAYAIEYDFIFPDQMRRSTQNKIYDNLFTAGQINGTSGYEEAAGQGLIAGLNAARFAAGLDPVELPRASSYIAVMLDDLVTKEIVEPYRLFTSRAEYRLHLRQDNADLRLAPLAAGLGLLPAEKSERFNRYREALDAARELAVTVKFQGKTLRDHLKQLGGELAPEAMPFPAELLKPPTDRLTAERIRRELVIETHYAGYLERENAGIRKLSELEKWHVPAGFDFSAVTGLSTEARIKLDKVRPSTLAQASRIDGVTPAELALLQIHLKRERGNG
ncbi:MAG: tRNA uridine-5-carboxymethylaminomethyl(34) synthesis enzyme MnmG [Victivallaceae bacterium]|nr:tRNA uridine-5-carboxymethylaminomethyl(34) synthesis enzyme MnmG [Victivallaceae bacterium]